MRLPNLPLFLAAAALAASPLAADRAINVASDEVEYGANGSDATFSGNVRVTSGDISVHAGTLGVQTVAAGQIYSAQSGATPIVIACATCLAYPLKITIGGDMRYDAAQNDLRIDGGVTLCAAADCAAGKFTADRATLQNDLLTLSGAPRITGVWRIDDSPLQLEADAITYHLLTREAVLTGAARLSRAAGEITGSRIRLNLKTGALQAESDSDRRVQATFGGGGAQ